MPAAPPPGLEDSRKVPMKILPALRGGDIPGLDAAARHVAACAAPLPAEALAGLAAQGAPFPPPPPAPEGCVDSSAWVDPVLAAVMHLNADGLMEAQAIFRRALGYSKQIEALDQIITSTHVLGGEFAQLPHLVAARSMKAEMSWQQQVLLRQLQTLCTTRRTNPADTAGGREGHARMADLPQQLQRAHQPEQKVDRQTTQLPPGTGWQAEQEQWNGYGLPHGPPAANASGGGSAQLTILATSAPSNSFPAQEKQQEKQQGRQKELYTLSTCLKLLSSEDPDCLLIVRRINKLGHKVVQKLKRYFSPHGEVKRVVIAHSTVSTQRSCEKIQRRSSLGFVQMATPEAVNEILAVGPKQEVDGSVIHVERFHRQSSQEEGLKGETNEGGTLTKDAFVNENRDRQSSWAGNSTATTGLTFSGGARSGCSSAQSDSNEMTDLE